MAEQNFEADALNLVLRKLRSNLIGVIVAADKEIGKITEMKNVPLGFAHDKLSDDAGSAKYPDHLPKKYRPVVDELTKDGYCCTHYQVIDYANKLRLIVIKNGQQCTLPLYEKACGIEFDILDTPWWKSVLERQKTDAEWALRHGGIGGNEEIVACFASHVASPEYIAEQEQKNKEARAMMMAAVNARREEEKKRFQDSFDEMVFLAMTGKTPEEVNEQNAIAEEVERLIAPVSSELDGDKPIYEFHQNGTHYKIYSGGTKCVEECASPLDPEGKFIFNLSLRVHHFLIGTIRKLVEENRAFRKNIKS